MLRLWPRRFSATIFPEACQLYRERRLAIGDCLIPQVTSFDVTQALDALLDAHPTRVGAEIDVIVSDTVARVIPLTWHDNLKNDEQQRAYARACLEQAGVGVGDEWVVQAAYRHFRSMGLGYALPYVLVARVRDHLLERGIALRSIMPLSACAYWRNNSGAGNRRTVLLLHERSRLSALLYDGRTCAGFYVQPMGTGLSEAAKRLFNTVETVFPAISHVHFWTPSTNPVDTTTFAKKASLPAVQILSGLRWK